MEFGESVERDGFDEIEHLRVVIGFRHERDLLEEMLELVEAETWSDGFSEQVVDEMTHTFVLGE